MQTTQSLPNISNVQIFEDIKRTSWKKFLSEWVLSLKVIYLILAGVIIIELFLGIKTLLTPIPEPPKIQPVSNGSIVLQSDSPDYKVGDDIEVKIKLSTGGHTTVGTDIILRYDPKFLEVLETDFFDKGVSYEDYPGVNVDPDSGMILLSGIALSEKEGFNGIGEFGTLNLKAKKNGKTTIKVDFTNGSTIDSNIIETSSAKDILTQVEDLDIYIGQENKKSEAGGKKSCTGFTKLCFDESGKQGTQECDGGKLEKNVCQFDPFLTDSCTSCETN